MFIPIVNYQQPPVTDGLIRFYDPQIEMSTGSILEQSGRGAAIGSGNGYSITTTVPSYVTFLNNQTNRFAAPGAADLDWTDGTISAWVYLNGTANINYCMINQRSAVGNPGTRFSLHLNPNTNTVGLYNAFAFYTVSTTIDNGIWYNITWQLSTTLVASAYVNGIFVGNAAAGSTINATSTLRAFEFGNADASFVNEALDGRIGQVWNYSRRLLPQEIYQIYQRTRDRYGLFI
jgi:hypothetical protein